MSTIKQKLAALRAKRTLKTASSLPIHPIHSNLHAPHISWDADYKTRLQNHTPSAKRPPTQLSSCSSEDEEDDQLIVLPPPTLKINAVAHRRLWRMREMERAREKNFKRLMENRPDAFESIQPCSLDASPDKEEEGDGGEEEEGDCGDDEAGQELEDEEEVALQSAGKLDAAMEVAPDAKDGHEDERAEEVDNLTYLASADGCDRIDNAHRDEFRQLPLSNDKSLGKAEETPNTADSSIEQRDGNSSPSNENAFPVSSKLEEQSSLQRILPVEDDSPPTTDTKFANTIASGSCAENHPLPRSDFIEDEAEDEDVGGGGDLSVIPDRDDAMSPGANSVSNEGVDENEISASEKKKLAAFHQKWLLHKEKEEVNALKANPRNLLDLEDDEPLERAKPDSHDLATVSSGEVSAGACYTGEESVAVELDGDNSMQANDYIETMFLRDDSRSRYIEDDEDAEKNDGNDIGRRERARALWKARRKIKKEFFQEDENSLSRFDIFNDVNKSRGSLLRAQLEGACRPVSSRSAEERLKVGLTRDKSGSRLKRSHPWLSNADASEWEKRNTVLAERERKRQRSVSISKWSFAAHGEKKVVASKSVRVSSSSSGRMPCPATYRPAKSRSRSSVQTSNQTLSRSRQKSSNTRLMNSHTSFRGLLDTLGGRAVTDDL